MCVCTVCMYKRAFRLEKVWNVYSKSADPGLHQGRGGAWDHRRCGSCLSWTLATPNAAGKSLYKATAMAQGHPPAAAMASFRRSRLPFARPQTLQNPPNAPNPPKVRPAPQGQSNPTSPPGAMLARKSHHKATAMAPGHLPAVQWLLIGVQGCRLPGLKPSKTLQTLQQFA